MPHLILKELPRYECLAEAAREFPDLDPTACQAFLHLIHAGDDVWRVMNGHFAEHGITQGRFLVMMLLMEKTSGGCPRAETPAELAELAQVSRATITGLLDTLERDGFVRRDPAPEDRRVVRVRLTPAGEKFMHAYLPGHFRVISALMNELTENERKTLSRLLAKVIAGIGGSAKPISS